MDTIVNQKLALVTVTKITIMTETRHAHYPVSYISDMQQMDRLNATLCHCLPVPQYFCSTHSVSQACKMHTLLYLKITVNQFLFNPLFQIQPST